MKIKVVHIITRMDMGGSAQNTLLTCLGLDKQEFNVMLVHGPSHESRMTREEQARIDDLLMRAAESGVRVIMLNPLIRGIDPAKDLRAFLSLCRILAKQKPDIVHTHTSKAGILGRWAALATGVPIIIHTPHGHVFYGHFKQMAAKAFFLAEKLTEPFTGRFVALTRGEKADYVRFGLTRPEKISTIHSGVDIGRFTDIPVDTSAMKKSLGLPQDAPVVGTVGWLLPIKGPMVLLRAMESVWKDRPETHLVYVGKGELEAGLKAAAAQMRVSDRVHFPGWRQDIPEIMSIFDIFVLPSLNEGMGRVIVEAMACCKPVIGSRAGGIPDLIEPDENGFLFEPGDSLALSESILKMINDPGLRDRMGHAGRLRATQFDLTGMVDKISMLYLQMMLKKRKRGVSVDHQFDI